MSQLSDQRAFASREQSSSEGRLAFGRTLLRSFLSRRSPMLSLDDVGPTESSLLPWRNLASALKVPSDRRGRRAALVAWLRTLGWLELTTGDPADSRSGDAPDVLLVRADRTCMSVWLFDECLDLDTPGQSETADFESPQRYAHRQLVERSEHRCLLLGAAELRVVVNDLDHAGHYFGVRIPNVDADSMGCWRDHRRFVSSWCSPHAGRLIESELTQFRSFKSATLKQIRRQLQRGTEDFLSSAVRLASGELNLEAPQLDQYANLLWQETLQLAFFVLVEAIAAVRAEEGLSRVLDAEQLRRFASQITRVPSVHSGQAPHEATWAALTKRTLCNARQRDSSDSSFQRQSLCRSLGFPHLDELPFDDSACAGLFRALLCRSGKAFEATERQLELLPLDDLTARDLADVFESMLDLRPGIAHAELVHYRCGNRDVVTSTVVDAGRARRPRQQGESIPKGSFFSFEGVAKKTSGAFYTPELLVEYLVSQALSPKTPDVVRAGAPGIAELLATRVLDPAMGAGAFLLATCARLGDLLFAATLRAQRSGMRQEVLRIPFLGARVLQLLEESTTAAVDAVRARQKARLLCRAAVAANCVYGVDSNPLSVAVTRLLIGLDCRAPGEPAVDLAEHFIAGDSLVGPRLPQLFELPHSGKPFDDAGDLTPYIARVAQRVARGSGRASLETGVAKALVAVWTGGVMLGDHACDYRYSKLVVELSRGASLASVLGADPELMRQYVTGASGICFELAFPEVFAGDDAAPDRRAGFTAVLGNPPWDAVRPHSREILAEFDPRIFDVKTRSERDALMRDLSMVPAISQRLTAYAEQFAHRKRAHDRQFEHQKIVINGDLAGRHLDAFRLFIERSWQLLRTGGQLGLVVPSAFHTAAGAAGVRKLLLETGTLRAYTVFRNAGQVFAISRGFEFGLLLAEKTPREDYLIRLQFGLERPAELVSGSARDAQYLHKSEVLAQSPYAGLFVSDDAEMGSIIGAVRREADTFASWEQRTAIRLRSTPTSVHRTHESIYFLDIPSRSDPRLDAVTAELVHARGALLHEGATFNRYDDLWGTPKFYFAPRRCLSVERWRSALGHYRVALRAIVGSSAHKCIATMLPPGTLVTNSALVEGAPGARTSAHALATVAVLNSSMANWLMCSLADLNVNLFALRQLPWPKSLPVAYLAHTALRLCAKHDGWNALWREQLGVNWREPGLTMQYPAVADALARQELTTGLDAVVAKCYGLDRTRYEKVLSHFGETWQGASIESYLDTFDALDASGMTAFTLARDPYADIALVDGPPTATFEPQPEIGD